MSASGSRTATSGQQHQLQRTKKPAKLLDRGKSGKAKAGLSSGAGDGASDEKKSDDDEDGLEDYSDFMYHLREKLVPPVLSTEDERNMAYMDKAKKLQKLLDSQLNQLEKDEQMIKVLDMTVKDIILCNIEHQAHCRRVLEILIGRRNVKCKLIEKVNKLSTCVKFQIVPAPELQFCGSPTQRSQLPFDKAMLEIPEIGPDGYCPFLDCMHSRYNRVSGESSARALKEHIKIHNLDKMRQESKDRPLHGFQSYIAAYGMLAPVDSKSKLMYLVYGDELSRQANHPEYMMSTSITRIIHTDSSTNKVVEEILENMCISERQATARLSAFSNILESEGIQLVYDFGAILEKIVKPAISDHPKTLRDAILMYESYYETNEQIVLYTHSIGLGLIGIVLHGFMDFLGPLVNLKLDHNIAGPSRSPPLSVYVEKLREIVSNVVTDEVEDFGRLKKIKESDIDPISKPLKKKNVKTTEHKQMVDNKEETKEDSDDETASVYTCDSDENQFMTLTGTDGTEYHPPSVKKVPSHYGKKSQGQSSGDESLRRLASLKSSMEKQGFEIKKLRLKNELAKKKLKSLKQKNAKVSSGSSKISSSKEKSSKSSVKDFVAENLGQDLSSDSDVVEVEDDDDGHKKSDTKPDSTSPKDLKRRSEESAASEADLYVPPSQYRVHNKWRWIESVSSEEEQMPEAPNPDLHENEEETREELQWKKETLEERYSQLQKELLCQKMENAARWFRDHIVDGVHDLWTLLMAAYGQQLDTNEDVCKCRQKLEVCKTQQSLGYTFRVVVDFVNRVERSILSGQVPERQMQCTKTDNSGFDPILGDVTDVAYEVSMPMIIKPEVPDNDEDEDLVIMGEMPASITPAKFISVKTEKVDEDAHSQRGRPSEENETSPEKHQNVVLEENQNLPEDHTYVALEEKDNEPRSREPVESEDDMFGTQRTTENEAPEAFQSGEQQTQFVDVETASQEQQRRGKKRKNEDEGTKAKRKEKSAVPCALQQLLR